MTLLEKVGRSFAAEKIKYAIVGGYAVALHGVPRGTLDLDLIVNLELETFIKVEKTLKSMGFESRLPVTAKEVFHFREDYIKNRNLIAWSFYNSKDVMEVIDIIITENLDNMSAVEMLLSNAQISVLSKKDLIAMKKRSARKQDLIDIEALAKI